VVVTVIASFVSISTTVRQFEELRSSSVGGCLFSFTNMRSSSKQYNTHTHNKVLSQCVLLLASLRSEQIKVPEDICYFIQTCSPQGKDVHNSYPFKQSFISTISKFYK
jgi:hypothetical protein